MPSTRSVGVFICPSAVAALALSAVLTAANVAAPIITVLRSISMSCYIQYDATGLRTISAEAMHAHGTGFNSFRGFALGHTRTRRGHCHHCAALARRRCRESTLFARSAPGFTERRIW